MLISISIVTTDRQLGTDLLTYDVGPDVTLSDLKTFVEAETNVPPEFQIFLKEGRPVADNSITLGQFGVQEGDLIAMAISSNPPRRRPAEDSATGEPSAQRTRTDNGQELLRLRIVQDRAVRAEVESRDPELAAAAEDPEKFRELYETRRRQNDQLQREKDEQMARLQADPFNLEAQQKIEEMIRQERVAENLQKAMEEFPEAFGRVNMLYIDVIVNNTPIKAFVDSGAQTTIMSPSTAERCGILRLIDKRYSGTAKGVGTAKILGRVHSAEIQIGRYNLASSFTVMEGKDVDLLLGLDMLKRHQMCIDLKKDCLRIGEDEIQFLGESELPKMMEETLENEPKVEGPGGTTIGAETGTIMPGTSTSTNTEQSQPQPSGSATEPEKKITEELIAKVTDLGFSRSEAIAALQQADGNVELAISLLL